jgi:hypothetical protein
VNGIPIERVNDPIAHYLNVRTEIRLVALKLVIVAVDEAPELIKPKRVCMAIPRSCEPLTQPGKVATIVSTGGINPS